MGDRAPRRVSGLGKNAKQSHAVLRRRLARRGRGRRQGAGGGVWLSVEGSCEHGPLWDSQSFGRLEHRGTAGEARLWGLWATVRSLCFISWAMGGHGGH